MSCVICEQKINLLPGPEQDEVAFYQHQIVHRKCLEQLQTVTGIGEIAMEGK